MLLSAALSSSVSAAVRDRGQGYFRSGAVTLESVAPTEVAAMVLGSDTYDVDLELDKRVVYASCTCPYVDENGTACKHIWATILAAEPRGFARAAAAAGRLRLVIADDLDDGPDPYDDEFDFVPVPPRRAPVRPKSKRETWRNQLDALRKDVHSAEGGRSVALSVDPS